jgi:phytanoyl-CoA hydroxylase
MTLENVPLESVQLKTELGTPKSSSLKYLRETTPDTAIEEMRKRYLEDGYLFIKHFFLRSDILQFRKRFFEYMLPTGIVEPGYEQEGLFASDKMAEDYAPLSEKTVNWEEGNNQNSVFLRRLSDAHVLTEYLELNEHPVLVDFVKRFTGWYSPVLYRRSIIRANVPDGEMTPVHYDRLFLRGSDPGFLTAWIPLGDIDLCGGGLIYLENSLQISKDMEDEWQKAANTLPPEEKLSAFNKAMTIGARCATDAGEFSDATGRKWMVANYEAGDVVFHQSFMIHASCQNQDPNNRIRLATDIRYTDDSKKVDVRWMNHFELGDGL